MTHRINPLFSRYVAEPTLDLLGVATDAFMTPHAVGGRRSVSSKYYIGEDFPFGYNGWCCRVFDTLCCREFADSTDKLAEEVIHFCIFGGQAFCGRGDGIMGIGIRLLYLEMSSNGTPSDIVRLMHDGSYRRERGQ